MSFGVADLIAQVVIEDGLKSLREHPHRLEYILNRHCQIQKLSEKVGDKYIKNAMDLIMTAKLIVRPYFVPDQDQYPNVMIAASYTEDQTFFNDYGSVEDLPKHVIEPILYAEFDLKGIGKDKLIVSPNYKLEEKVWIGLEVTNGKESAKVTGIFVREGKDTELFIDKTLPEGTALRGWKAQTPKTNKAAVINVSSDKVTIQCKLATSGDPDVHRIFATVMRYCLKRGRKLFDFYGIQNVYVAQTPPMVTGQEDMIMETVFTVEGIIHDSWIEREVEPVGRIDLESVLVSENPKNQRVKL